MPGFKPPKPMPAVYQFMTRPWVLAVLGLVAALPLALAVLLELSGEFDPLAPGGLQNSRLGQAISRYFAGYSMSRRR